MGKGGGRSTCYEFDGFCADFHDGNVRVARRTAMPRCCYFDVTGTLTKTGRQFRQTLALMAVARVAGTKLTN